MKKFSLNNPFQNFILRQYPDKNQSGNCLLFTQDKLIHKGMFILDSRFRGNDSFVACFASIYNSGRYRSRLFFIVGGLFGNEKAGTGTIFKKQKKCQSLFF